MIAVILALSCADEFPFAVDVAVDGQVHENIGRAQISLAIDAESERVTSIFRYESSDRDVVSRREEVFDRSGRLISSLTGQTLSGERETLVELKKLGGKWNLYADETLRKNDFPVTITDRSLLWGTPAARPEIGTKAKVQRFDGNEKVDELTAVVHGEDDFGWRVERWQPGFNEQTWYDEKGRVVRMEIANPPDSSKLIYRRVAEPFAKQK